MKKSVKRSEKAFGWLALPEMNLAIFAFLLNFVWEMWQVPFFENTSYMPHWEGVKFCTRATLGDVAITLLAFWTVAAFRRSRAWILRPGWGEIMGFLAIGLLITVGIEAIAVNRLHLWEYGDAMPTLPVLGTGLLPLAQWIILPLLTVWFVRRQLQQMEVKP